MTVGITLTYLLLTAVLVAPFALIALTAAHARRNGFLRWNLDQFRLSSPMVGPAFDDHADGVRTRFERRPSWPRSGALGERR